MEKINIQFGDIISDGQYIGIFGGDNLLENDYVILKLAINIHEPDIIELDYNVHKSELKQPENNEKLVFCNYINNHGYDYNEVTKILMLITDISDKVLVKNKLSDKWKLKKYSHFNPSDFSFCCVDGKSYKYCVSYENHEYLLNTNENSIS